MSIAQLHISPQQLEAFDRDGFFVLENVVAPDDLELLRAEVAKNIARIDDEMDAKGVTRLGINSKGSRYFVNALNDPHSPVRSFLFSDLMAQVTRATLGPDVWLFHEQYVVKAAERGEAFSWHQDSGYVGHPKHKPYLSCWITLDDVSEQNGTVYMLPYSQAGTREFVYHQSDSSNNDLVGYNGDDPGVPVVAPAGSIAVFSSTCFHRSGPNQTDKMRRIYLAQYSSEIIMSEDGTRPWALSEPFLKDGDRITFG